MKREFGVDLKRLVRIFSRNLYGPNSDVVVRELIQNAYDAINLRHRGKDNLGRIDITTDSRGHTLTVADNGTGMDEKALIEYLSKLGASLKELEKADPAKAVQIGEYGIGFFSAFIIAEEIVVRTCSVNQQQGWRWVSSGVDGYDLAPDLEPLPEPGTHITLRLGPDSHRYGEPGHVERLVTRDCQFLDRPIHLNGSEKPINEMRFAWELSKEKDQLTWVRKHVNPDAEFYKVGSSSAGRTRFQYAFGCGFRAVSRQQQLYSKRMFVSKKQLFVPEYLEFMNVLVCCDAFQLNLAREEVQGDTTFREVAKQIEELLLEWLSELARKHREEPLFKQMILQNQSVFHELAARDPRTLDKIYPYLHFPVHGNDQISIARAAERPSAAPRTILYTVPAKGTLPSTDESPFLLRLATAQDIPVFEPADEDAVELLRQVCTKYRLELRKLTECPELRCTGNVTANSALEHVRDYMVRCLHQPARIAPFPPASLPLAVLDGTILLNADNVYLKQLGQLKTERDDLLRPIYVSLLGVFQALARTPATAGVDMVVHEVVQTLLRWGEVTEKAAANQKQLDVLTQRWWIGPAHLRDVPERPVFTIAGRPKTYTRRCMIVRPFSEYYIDVQNVVIETCAEFGILAESAEQPENQDILQKVCRHIDRCDFVIADVSDNNPNVLFELGIAMARRKPSIILSSIERRDTRGLKTPTDIIGIERIEYANVTKDLRSKLQLVLKQLGEGHAAQSHTGTE